MLNKITKLISRTLSLFLILTIFVSCAKKDSIQLSYVTEMLIEDSLRTVKDIINSYQENPKFIKNLNEAEGILIIPKMFKVGLVGIGGEGGKGVFLVRGTNGNWSYPAFYKFVNMDVGLTVGLEFSSIMYIMTSAHDTDSFIRKRFAFKPEFSIGIYNVGGTFLKSFPITSEIGISAYAINRGFYFGASLGFGGILPLDEYSMAFYNDKQASSDKVIFTGSWTNIYADKLRAELNRFR